MTAPPHGFSELPSLSQRLGCVYNKITPLCPGLFAHCFVREDKYLFIIVGAATTVTKR